MPRDLFDQASELFLAARAIEPAQRTAFLDAACGGDPALRALVEDLLAGDGRALPAEAYAPAFRAAVDELHPFAPASPAPEPAGDGERAYGPYRALQLIGEGGFGEVHLAEQSHPVRRRVALKVLKPGMDSRQVLARFEAERQALALMDHPNIAHILDAGTSSDGRPFFAMELLAGVPINRYCEDHRLSPRERLELFLPVCDAVQHAHQKGIIHRDLKPGNVLVVLQDQKPVPKVIDFGIAKAVHVRLTDRTLVTEQQMWMGTPEYMAPEQADTTGLDVDTRADIYSLGVLLYEMLTGTTPFEGRLLRGMGSDELRRLLREVDPPTPSRRLATLAGSATPRPRRAEAAAPGRSGAHVRHRSIRGEIDWIVMKCLEKDRGRRYAAAGELAQDIRRHLADQPVSAGPPGAAYLLRKFARRHRRLFAAASIIVIALMLGLGAALFGLVRADCERSRAQAAVTRLSREMSRTHRMLGFLRGLLESSGPGHAAGRDVSLKEILDRGTVRIATGDLGNDPATEAEIRGILGRAAYSVGHYATGEENLRAALKLHLESRPSGDTEVALARMDLAALVWRRGGHEEAERLYREALAVLRRTGPRESLATVLANLANLLWLRGRVDNALPLAEEALDLRRELHGDDDPAIANSLSTLARLRGAAGDQEEAECLFREAIRLLREGVGDSHPEVGLNLSALADLRRARGETASAIDLYRRAAVLLRRVLGAGHPDLAATLDSLGRALGQQGELAESAKAFGEALDIRRTAFGEDHALTADTAASLGDVLMALGEPGRAEPLLAAAVQVLRRRVAGSHPALALAESGWASALAASGHGEEALALFEAARARLPEDDPKTRVARSLVESRLAAVRESMPAPATAPGSR